MYTSVRSVLTALIGCIGVFFVDQFSKRIFFQEGHSFFFLNGWIQSIHHQNYGIAFNIPIPQWLILVITSIACAGAIILLIRKRTTSTIWFGFSLGLLLGGALGNAFDRFTLGFVRDWLLLWFRSAINIADVGVLLGLVGAFWFAQHTKDQQS